MVYGLSEGCLGALDLFLVSDGQIMRGSPGDPFLAAMFFFVSANWRAELNY